MVLRPLVDSDEIEQIIENKKTLFFRKLLQKPKKNEVHVHSIKLIYEAFLILSGKYSANFYRKATHPISVDYTVKEIIFGDVIFPIKQGKGVLGKLGTKIKSRTKIKLPYKMSSEIIESYPKRTLQKTDGIVRKPEITYDAAVGKLVSKLKQSVSIGRRNLVEKIDIDEIIELYVPIYEARLIGPRKNVRIMRIDGMRKKVL